MLDRWSRVALWGALLATLSLTLYLDPRAGLAFRSLAGNPYNAVILGSPSSPSASTASGQTTPAGQTTRSAPGQTKPRASGTPNATATPGSTATPAPGGTPTPAPTASASSTPTATPTPTPTGTAAPTPTPAPTPPPTPTPAPTPPPTNGANSFVTRSGSTLLLNGTPYRFAGTNMYWLGLSEDGGIHYPSHTWIDSAMNDARTMGATVVRTHGSLSVGCSLCIEPALGVFNPSAWDSLDYAIAAAKSRNIRLVLPLVDNYQYFQGGKLTYLSWRGIPADSVGSQFFTNPTVLGDFEQHIAAVLNHVNPYTGLAYRNDPAILAWETGNELSVYPSAWTYSSWTDQVSRYIKLTLGARQLVIDGKYGIYSIGGTLDTASLQLSYVDIYSNHAYDNWRPPSEIVAESNTVHAYGKVFILGEYSWTDRDVNGNFLSWTLPAMLSAVETDGVNGDMYWELLPNGVSHNDGFTLHWPGDTADMQTRALALQAHAFVMCLSSGICRTQ